MPTRDEAMLGAFATCLMLLALGLPGVIALRRLTDQLTALEEWVYGLPLGAVVGSLALLVLAIIPGGLSTGLVIVVAAVSLAAALGAWPWPTLVAAIGAAAGRQQPLGFVATTTKRRSEPGAATITARRRAEERTMSRPASMLAVFGPLSAVILGLFALRWAILWSSALVYDGEGLWAGQVNIWGDWALHLGDVTSFVYGDNFPRRTRAMRADRSPTTI